jgi:hypothetical protein
MLLEDMPAPVVLGHAVFETAHGISGQLDLFVKRSAKDASSSSFVQT